MAKRIFNFDPDYRRQPKTNLFCAMCQRDIKPGSAYGFMHWDGDDRIAHPEDLDGTETKVVIGPECKKQVPIEYQVR